MTEQGTQISDAGFNVAVVGATGAVGQEMLAILAERNFPVARLRAMASARSAGGELDFRGQKVPIEDLQKASFEGVDFALFSAGSKPSLEHAPRAVSQGCIVIDNTSAFRMNTDTPLVVPEVNPHAIIDRPGIIANPNCSTIQMVVALKPLAEAAGLKRVVVSTYQSASGAGQKGIDELLESSRAYLDSEPSERDAAAQATPSDDNVFAYPLAFDVLPQIDSFLDSGFTREEVKMIDETRKIMELSTLEVAATCVRVPAVRSHSESITIDLEKPLSVAQAHALWADAPGISLLDAPATRAYPRARQAERTDATWIGRVRQDLDRPNTLHFWCVSDNLRKGAALNAVQIAEEIVRRRG